MANEFHVFLITVGITEYITLCMISMQNNSRNVTADHSCSIHVLIPKRCGNREDDIIYQAEWTSHKYYAETILLVQLLSVHSGTCILAADWHVCDGIFMPLLSALLHRLKLLAQSLPQCKTLACKHLLVGSILTNDIFRDLKVFTVILRRLQTALVTTNEKLQN